MEENRKIYVVDASIILKWFLSESEDNAQAMQFYEEYVVKDEFDIHVPSHCFFEVMNTLLRKKPEAVEQAFSLLKLSCVYEHHLNLSGVHLAKQLIEQFPKIAFYDAAYHALAQNLGAVFITADEKYYKKTHKAGNVLLLKNYA